MRTCVSLTGARDIVIFLIVCFCTLRCSPDASDRITPYERNPFYWQYRGKPVLLIGGSDEDNLVDNPAVLIENFKTLKKSGGNYVRLSLSCSQSGGVKPYRKIGESYDLESFNPEFWDRLGTIIQEALKRDIIVQVEIWATSDFYGEYWLNNPFNPVCNSNYIKENTPLPAEWDYYPVRNPQPFFYSPPELNNDTILRGYQEAYVRKVLDFTAEHPNILYCLDDATKAPSEWAFYWGNFINKEAQKRNVSIHLTEMWEEGNISDPIHADTYEHPGIFSYTEVSANNSKEGDTHYNRLMWYRDNLKRNAGGPRPMNNVKVHNRFDNGGPNSAMTGLDRWWQNIFAGCAGTCFHKPPDGIGLDNIARKHIFAARRFTSLFDIFSCEPRPDLLSAREENEAHLLALPGIIYALYFPYGGRVKLDLIKLHDARYRLRWFDIDTAEFEGTVTLINGEEIDLITPTDDKMWLGLLEAI